MGRVVDGFNAKEREHAKADPSYRPIEVEMVIVSSIEQKLLIASAGGNPPDVAGIYSYMTAGYADKGALSDLSGLAKNLRRHPDGRYRWHWDPRFVAGTKPPDVPSQHDRLFACSRALRIPTLLVRGRMSDLVTPEAAREFLELAPHAQFADVSGAGHMVAGDRNDLFTDAVLRFLTNLDGRH